MNLIDWFDLFANSLWILGCALGLAALSYASWQASLVDVKLGARLETPGCRRTLFVSGLLFCTGLAMLSTTTLEIALWVVLGVLFGVGLAGSVARRGRSKIKG